MNQTNRDRIATFLYTEDRTPTGLVSVFAAEIGLGAAAGMVAYGKVAGALIERGVDGFGAAIFGALSGLLACAAVIAGCVYGVYRVMKAIDIDQGHSDPAAHPRSYRSGFCALAGTAGAFVSALLP